MIVNTRKKKLVLRINEFSTFRNENDQTQKILLTFIITKENVFEKIFNDLAYSSLV